MSTEDRIIHKSVLVDEVLHYLEPKPGKTYVDVTFGSGGHTRAILEHEPEARVIALDWDSISFDTYAPAFKEEFGDRLTLIWGNFALLYKLLAKAGIKQVDGVLADFGTSQMQIKERPGFSVYNDLPLDMRMSPPHQKITAAELLNKASEEKLREIFWQLGEERFARQIVQAIVAERKKKRFQTTGQLVAVIERAVPMPKKRTIHPATRVFQALRIYVNKELENIRSFLSGATRALNPDGRLVCISFHSLEDRLVKQFFKEQESLDVLRVLTPKVVTASPEELATNPSSRSARLRAAQRI